MTTVLKAKWHQLENHGEAPYPRHGYRAVALHEDLLIIHGGGDGRYVYRDLYILQPSTGEWRKISIPSLPERAGFGLALINNNMYMFGGMSYNRKCLNDLYYLSLTTWKCHTTGTPGISTLDIHAPVTHITATSGITTLDILTPVTHTTSTPGISTLDIHPPVTHTPATPGITVSDIRTPGSSCTPIIYTSASVTPVPPHRSTLETFLKPKPILSKPSSVKLIRSSTGRPLAVVPKSLIPDRTIACGTKPSNIVIVARKRPFI
ncbi:hypothetical protein LSTR_LSTR011003 [Laodelphax striatellus]|uniref:Uncharacterized protein n=1 Tax=Laodelphax striatellus TaxID=195883 RepID=A0A482X4X2_LAOST|nr:hypothetical protein LSTR_LSTR011003 [Laodelphax striatellus]